MLIRTPKTIQIPSTSSPRILGFSEFAGEKTVSAQESRGIQRSFSVDLRRQSIASLSSAGGSLPSELASPPGSASLKPEPSSGVTMHLDIQLYEMEPGVFLVDFKCAGYETPDGMLLEEKDVTSPFPFLDLASKLIIQLAEAD
jgi:carbon catabolite-derepressing protein kinase